MRQSLNLSPEARIEHRNELARNYYYRTKEKNTRAGYFKILEMAFNRFSERVEEGIKEAEQNHGEMVNVSFAKDMIDLTDRLMEDKRFRLIYKEKDGD